jgi:hypothetical protein
MMKLGGFIPSVDHQTPPGVSLEQYRTYLRLLEEYTSVASGEVEWIQNGRFRMGSSSGGFSSKSSLKILLPSSPF